MPRVKLCINCTYYRTIFESYDKNTCLKGWKYGANGCPYYRKRRSK
jgi:hypothetical protein